MAEVVVNYDTVTKKLTISIDGKAQKNVSSVNFEDWAYEGDPEFHMGVTMRESLEEGGMYKVTRISASEDGSIVEGEDKEAVRKNIGKALVQ